MTKLPENPPHVPRLEQTCYLIICRDGPTASELRVTHLEGHMRHVEKHWRRYISAGPIREPGGDALVGSVFLLLADSLEDAQTVMNGDPYISCGMYETIEYKEFTNSIGQYMGGKIWESIDAIRHRATGGPPSDVSKGVKG
jgi:uncharacterized protein YciI